MSLSLHAAIIPNWLQQLGALANLLDKAEALRATKGLAERDLIALRLTDDMLPFGYQVKSCGDHTRGALAGVRAGSFSPSRAMWPETLDGLRDLVREAIAECESVGVDDLAGLAANDMAFTMGEKVRYDFTVQDFLLSFSTPNLYFHATTAYDILRANGAEIGKQHYLGALRMKPA